jgi:hypothetical protein
VNVEINYLLLFNVEIYYYLQWTRGQCVQLAIAEVKATFAKVGWVTKICYLKLLRASEGTLNRWSRHYHPAIHICPALGYGPFSLCVIHKEDVCPSSWDINTLSSMKVNTYS